VSLWLSRLEREISSLSLVLDGRKESQLNMTEMDAFVI
jgi:hypothetical protein